MKKPTIPKKINVPISNDQFCNASNKLPIVWKFAASIFPAIVSWLIVNIDSNVIEEIIIQTDSVSLKLI